MGVIPVQSCGENKIVISLGGSVFLENGLDVEKIKDYGKAIDSIAEKYKVFVVVGGGKIARDYINAARLLGGDETTCDKIGIEVTRINALILALCIKKAPKIVPKSFEEAYKLSNYHRVIVMGGTFPGHTTDATAALLAEYIGAKLLLNATAVDGIYTKDPKEHSDARKIDRISPKELLEIVIQSGAKAGSSGVLDVLSVKIIERSKIKTIVFLGTPENIKKAAEGKKIGTVIEV
ncbi:UMP kinase [Candidatus Bathyarchaeota archaeon]|nr:MAG: UMP kinase [Candidatus Bathyarchaeota archaeon]